jgi:hypothetical protein
MLTAMNLRLVGVIHLLLLLLNPAAMASPIVKRQAQEGDISTVIEYNDETFIENLTLLPDGRILYLPLSRPELLAVDPDDATPSQTSLITFPEVNSVGAIAQVGPNKYAIIGGNHSFFSFELGSMKVFVVKLDTSAGRSGLIGSTIESVIPVEDTTMLNGMVSLPGPAKHITLTHDSIQGRLFRIDTRSGEVSVASDHPIFGRGGNELVPLGANGIKVRDGFLYFTNSAQGVFARVRLDAQGYLAGEPEIVAQLDGDITLDRTYDDFDFDKDGNAYVTMHPATLMKITPSGEQTVFAGGPGTSTLRHPTSAVFSKEENAVYVSTGGDWENVTGGGGQIVKIQLESGNCS